MIILRIIPVIDILNSVAVHAIKGNRTKYNPLKSVLTRSTNPIKISNILKKKYDFNEIYIADLDAILKNRPNFNLFSRISKGSEIKIMLDPGIEKISDVSNYSKFNLNKLILGLETVLNLSVIEDSLEILGDKKIIVSIDMFKSEVLSKIKEFRNLNPIQVVKMIQELGVNEIIILDLFRVGQKLEGIPPLFLEILHGFNGDVLVGGGIKNMEDMIKYESSGFAGVLIATAIHDGSINLKKLKEIFI